jgi:hypothetical protein
VCGVWVSVLCGCVCVLCGCVYVCLCVVCGCVCGGKIRREFKTCYLETVLKICKAMKAPTLLCGFQNLTTGKESCDNGAEHLEVSCRM